MSNKTIILFTIFTLLSLFIFDYSIYGQSDNPEECTIGVAIGAVTSDGRPLLWKTRDDTETDNVLNYNTSFRYKFISVSNAGSSSLSWMGVNEHGFAIVNSNSTDLIAYTVGPGNGALMRDVLGNCKTVAEFQNYLDSTNRTGRSTRSNFGVIDSTGAAAIYETGGKMYIKFDANNSPIGFIVRTNFSITGGGTVGLMRYKRSSELISDFVSGDTLNYKSIIRYQMRDFSDNIGDPVPVPYTDSWDNGIPYGYINCKNSICHSSSVSSAVIHGVLPNELAGLSTMWVMLGHPASTISLPYWPVGNTPYEACGDSTAELCDNAKEISAMLFDYSLNDNYIDSYKLSNSNGDGLWSCIFPIEDHIFSETKHFMDSVRGLKVLPISSLLNKEEDNASFSLSELQYCRNTLIELESDCLIKVYPNPALLRIYIHIPQKQNFKIRIVNFIGECVLQKELKSSMNEIDISSLAKGLYIIQLINENKTFKQKLIKV